MKKILLAIALLSGVLSATDSLTFKVTLLGVKCAEVEVVENYLDNGVVEIVYHAFTVGPFYNLYPTDNWYYYYTNTDFTHLDSLKKDISDQDLKQDYREDIQGGYVLFDKTFAFEYDKPLHHVLSSLIFLEHHPEYIKTGAKLPFDITDEGDFYHQEIGVISNEKKAQDEVYFTFHHTAGKEYLTSTDVFNWMICAGEGTRMLAFSKHDHTITEGSFSLGWGGLHLKAKRIY